MAQLSDFAQKRLVHEVKAIRTEILQRSLYRESILIHSVYKAGLTPSEFQEYKLRLVKKLKSDGYEVAKVNVKEDTILALKINFDI